jgi:putative transposase
VSKDNPFSESQFKTLKYQFEFLDRFESLESALGFCNRFFEWYNEEHHHTGIGLLTPSSLHQGRATLILGDRHRLLEAAYDWHPKRFLQGRPKPIAIPAAVWINPPTKASKNGHKLDPKPPISSSTHH